MNDKIICKCTDNCTEEVSLYEMIQSLPIESGLKEQILEKVRNLNKLNSELEDELHNCRIEVKKLKKIILKLVYELYEE